MNQADLKKQDPDELKKKNILHIQDLSKFYGEKCVLHNVDLSVKEGEFCTVVGPSGCGKSTLLKLILGQERQDEGDVFIESKPAGYPDPKRGVVYQKYSLYPNMTVLENVMLSHSLSNGYVERRRRKKEFLEEAMMYIEKVKLADHIKKMPDELSGGMQQRVAIVQALIKRPKILLMDEPFGALDPGTREDLQIFLLKLWKEYGMTILFITHDLEEAVYISTRIVVLSQYYRDGRPVAGNNHGSRIVADYPICRAVLSTKVKETADFGELIGEIRKIGFDPKYLQRVTDFNLLHPDSFQTLTPEECEMDVEDKK